MSAEQDNESQSRSSELNQLSVKSEDAPERESSGSLSVSSEHPKGLSFNEYMRRYDFNCKVITWPRDTYGLFDYEFRTPIKAKFKFDTEQVLIRVASTCYLETLEADIDRKYRNKAQLLAYILKERNKFIVKPGPLVKWEKASPEEREVLRKYDVDDCYKDEGEQMLEPKLMNEPMYIIARSMINRGVKQCYVLSKGDIIKLGRVKFRVVDVQIEAKKTKREKKQRQAEERKRQWEDLANKQADQKAFEVNRKISAKDVLASRPSILHDFDYSNIDEEEKKQDDREEIKTERVVDRKSSATSQHADYGTRRLSGWNQSMENFSFGSMQERYPIKFSSNSMPKMKNLLPEAFK